MRLSFRDLGILLWLLVLGVSLPVMAATKYVDGALGADCTSGNYSIASRNCTGSAGNAWNTLREGIINLASSDTLYIRSGTYSACIDKTIDSALVIPSGTSSVRTTIAGYAGETVTLTPQASSCWRGFFFSSGESYITIQDLKLNAANLNNNSGRGAEIGYPSAPVPHHIRLQNIEIYNAPADGISIQYGANNVDIIGCNIHDNGGAVESPSPQEHGIYVASNNNLLENNVIHHNSGWGVHGFSSSGGVFSNTLRGNRSYANAADGILIGSGNNNVVYNNSAWSNAGFGIQVRFGGAANTKVYSNTVYGNTGAGIRVHTGASNTDLQNNISYNHGAGDYSNAGTGTSESTNLFGQNPGFVSVAGGSEDFHIAAAGSAAVNAGATLGAPYDVDAESISRPSGQYTIGAYQFVSGGGPPTPIGNFAKYTFEDGSGLTVSDVSGQGHHCTLNTAGWTTGIIGSFALDANGARECHVTTVTGMLPSTFISLGVWFNGAPPAGDGLLVAMYGAWGISHLADGRLRGFVRTTGGIVGVESSAAVLNSTNRHAALTKDATGLRLWIDAVQVGFTATTAALSYPGGHVLYIGGNPISGEFFNGRLDNIYLIDTALDQNAVNNLFNDIVPPTGLFVTHQHYTTADAVEGVFVGTLDAEYSSVITAPLGIRWAIHKSDTGSLTEYFRVFCRIFMSAGSALLAWDPPTQNADGTPLLDLAGHKVFWGTSSGNYSTEVDVGMVTHARFDNLPTGQTLYFAAKAYDTFGNHSVYSAEITKTLPAGATWGPWTEVGNTLSSLGVRFYVDSAVNLGTATSALLPLDGFSATAGKFIADTVDVTSPYDAVQRVTISQGQHLDYEVRLSFGSPLVSGHAIQCRPHRATGLEFGASHYANIRALTLQAISPPSNVRLGGVFTGGTQQ